MNDNDLYPLSLPQEAFYYDYLLNCDDHKYIMGGAMILEGDLNIELYQKAYNYVIKHFDVMRMRFVKKGDILYQQFRPEYQCEIKYLDFRRRINPVEEGFDYILMEFQKPIPIENEDLYFEIVIQIDDKRFISSPKFHHMMSDGMGKSIISQAFSDTYNSLLEKGCYAELKTFSYIDFINDDLQYRNSDSFKKSFEYWKHKLARLPEPFGFTSKKKSIKNISLHTERLALNLHRICFESILNIAFETEATTFQVILGLIATTLCRCYKRNEMIIGMPVLNRSNHKFRNTPGLFMNMMALRLNINPDGSFEEIINTVKSEVREGYRHQRFPLRDTIRHLRSNPEFNNELFDVTVVYRKNDFSQRFGEAKIKTVTLDTAIRNESLSIEIDEYDDEGNINIFFNYNRLVISEDEMVQFIRCFETVLMDIIHFPDKKIKDITLLNDFDAHKILCEFNYPAEKTETEKTIVELFEEIADKYSDAEAVICNDNTISYKELNEKANRIANYLLANYKIQPEEIICMALDRSIDAIAAILGIMKTGAAYLPIDIDSPIDRMKYIVKNSGARIIVKSGFNENDLAEIVVDFSDIVSQNKANTGIKIRPDNLAYVIYTSGSTGKPKGVLIEHGHFMNMFVNTVGIFGVTETDHILQFASLGFDASIIEIFDALLTGAVLVIADKEKIRNTELFVRYVKNNKVTIMTLPPVYLSALNKVELPFVNTLITAGEQAIPEDVNFYKQSMRFINGYGPTETSVCACLYIAEKDKDYQIVPIGKPSPNLKLYILDECLKPVPIGFEGELCISGLSLARGYLNNEELTKQKFVKNPFEPGARLYRTGDLARWKQDGNIEFAGRIDDQVKIKGNRIEPGEIEFRLLKYDKIKNAAVLDIQRGGAKELAAYIHAENKIDITGIKMYLRQYLPEYMIPLNYVFVDKIPLTQNGKIDKETLRKMTPSSLESKIDYIPAASEMESRLIKMFEDILDVKQVGVEDSFFELGGESLKIARLISKIYKELKREISFKVIFDSPTVRSIAAELEAKAITGYEEIAAAPVKEYYALSHAQKRLWILTQNKKDAAVYNMPVSLLLEGTLNQDALEESLKKIIQRHESLRTIFVDINGNPYQKILNDYNFTIEKYDLSEANNKDETAHKIVNEKIVVPFDLTCEIPIRANIIKLDRTKHIFLLTMHHIAGDGISIGIIMKELSGLYNSFIDGNRLELKPLRIQYKDYCEYEKGVIESKAYNDEKLYWLRKLHSPLPVLELAYDKQRPPIKTYSGGYLFFEIKNTVSRSLLQFSKEQNVSIYIVMVYVINILLHKYSSDEDIIIGSPVAGRNHPDLEDQVGVYINTIALRNRINESSSIMEFINDVKVNSTDAMSNSNFPFDRLIQTLNLNRDTSHSPLFDVLVQYQNSDIVDLKLNGVTSSFYEAEYKYTKYDLTFTFVEEGQKIRFSIGYNTGLFYKERIERTARHINNIITSVLNNPAGTIKEIDILDAGEKDNLINLSSGQQKEFDKAITIPELFENQALKTPNNKAIVFNDNEYTYKQLDELANMIANEIRSKTEINPDDVIGIMTARSELMIIGILGILKAGAAYLPLDPDYPTERIAFMLEDSKAKLLLTENNLFSVANDTVDLVKSAMPQKTIVLDISIPGNDNNKKPELNISSSNLAYLIYTSGSTGKPKGVMVEHRSLYNLVLGLAEEIYKTVFSPLNIALISPFVFDASIKQIFYALLNGHCLDIVPDEIKANGRKLLEFYEAHSINVSDGTPMHLEIIADELNSGTGKYLPERFVIGGQQLMYQTVKKIFESNGKNPPAITNVYGPTECCDVSTCYTIIPEMFNEQETAFNSLPIGKPLNNVQVFILDSNHALVPVGIDGSFTSEARELPEGILIGLI